MTKEETLHGGHLSGQGSVYGMLLLQGKGHDMLTLLRDGMTAWMVLIAATNVEEVTGCDVGEGTIGRSTTLDGAERPRGGGKWVARGGEAGRCPLGVLRGGPDRGNGAAPAAAVVVLPAPRLAERPMVGPAGNPKTIGVGLPAHVEAG